MKLSGLRTAIERVTHWRNRLVVDAASAALEASLALFFSSLCVLVLVISYALETSGAGWGDALNAMLSMYFDPTDALQYLTAILSSTTAYTLLRLSGWRDHIFRVVSVLGLTLLLWFFATPLFVAREPENVEFAGSLAIWLVSAGLFVWWFSLFSQRRILEKAPQGHDRERADELTKKLEKY